MKKYTLAIILSMMGTLAFAQWGEEEMDEKPSIKDRLFFGGGFGASFGSYWDFVSVSPLVGYKITKKLAGGVQFQYRYTNYKQFRPKFSTSDFGASPFLRYSIFPPFFLHAEYEYLNYQYPVNSAGDKQRFDFNSFLAGGGLFQPIGRKAGLYILALYNFSYTDTGRSPYNSPLVLRAGLTAGF